ncbi:MAG: VWA domain-containing protein, partial [Acidobacteriaceae bacterium]|nr:VWA domain-containing protein [Acidobacteriaceae bacterium]
RTQYLLGYYPAHRVTDSSFRTISVSLSHAAAGNNALVLRHRTGYYSNAAQ